MKARVRSRLVGFLRASLSFAGSRARNILADALSGGDSLSESIETVRTPRGDIAFACPGALPLWRARTLLTKEPETLQWIDGISPGDTLWDIGANVGVYSLYAGIARNCHVLAFEPAAGNYYLLNRNIEINDLARTVQAYCVAFNDKTVLDVLNMHSTELGGALSSFSSAVDNFGAEFSPKFLQGMVGYSIDDFIDCFEPAFPNHIKIDVDGIEDKIVFGARKTLSDQRMRSVSIELDADRSDYVGSVTAILEEAGLNFVAKRHAEMFEGGKYANIYNYEFRRLTH